MFWGVVCGLSLAGIAAAFTLAVVEEQWLLERLLYVAPAVTLLAALLVFSVGLGWRRD